MLSPYFFLGLDCGVRKFRTLDYLKRQTNSDCVGQQLGLHTPEKM